MFDFLKGLLSSSNESQIKQLRKTVAVINGLEKDMQSLSDEDIPKKTEEFKKRAAGGESLDSLLPEAFALAREAAVRTIGQRAFDVQLIGGIVLHQGRIAEMRTGEGKTLTLVFPAYLNALAGKGVHVVTVNEYLARFHSEWMGNVYRFLGMTVGLVLHDQTPEEKQRAYAADITYGTNNEFGFDYLRDNMVAYKERMVQRDLNFAIVDEVDSILIDEARTPLIISGQGEKSTELYTLADRFARRLTEGEDKDFTKDDKEKHIVLTEQGVRKAEAAFGVDNLTDPENQELYHHILTAMRAHYMMTRDIDYVVKNGEVLIVDEFTGRIMVGRRYSDGLHQAIEAKENVKVARESRTLATITFQNYFRMYKKLSGTTGTAKTEEEEFQGIYKLDVVVVPTNRPMIRNDLNDAVFVHKDAKLAAVVEEVVERHATGQPILVGTVSVEMSERMSRMLDLRGIDHTVLNAKYHDREAEIIAQAGKKGAVTIATNMAGRGTDILLGGNAEYMARKDMRANGWDEEIIEEAIGHAPNVSEEVLRAREEFNGYLAEHLKETQKGHDEVVALGGLHIIGTERHESRRIDNQLRGRAGRQGDPGSSRFYVSFEDDLMRLFGSDRFRPMLEKLTAAGEDAIEYGIVSKQIENAQKRVESRNYEIRKNVLRYDDVMNQQREIIYGQRREVLEGGDMRERVKEMRDSLVKEAVERATADEVHPDTWNLADLAETLEKLCLMKGDTEKLAQGARTREELVNAVLYRADEIYAAKEREWTEAGIDMRELERAALLGSVDRRWMDHIDAMDTLRDGIGLRAYGQRDPIVEYKMEGYDMFEEMVHLIREDTVRKLYFFVPSKRPVVRREATADVTNVQAGAPQKSAAAPRRAGAAVPKVGRNDPCPCGSGKKYKECCGRNA